MVVSSLGRPAELRFRDLGPLVVSTAEGDRRPGGTRPAAALALLLMNVNRRVSADALREAMWGDETHQHVSSTLDTHMFRLRKVLEPGRAAGDAPSVLLSDAGGFRLVAAPDRVDSLRFLALVAETEDLLRTGQPRRALTKSDEALGMRRGRPFEPVTDEIWASTAVARLEEAFAQLLERHIEALLACGEPARALQELVPLTAEHPLRERLWAQRMEAAWMLGRPEEALRAFQDARARLVDELGIEPGPELQGLQGRILGGDESPGRGREVAAPAVAPATPVVTESRPQAGRLPRRSGDLFGRADELERIRKLCLTRPVITITGAGGCGKTRLALEVAHRVAPEFVDGTWFVDLSSVQDDDEVVEAVTSELGLAPTTAGDRFDLVRMFVRDRRLLLILDNCEHVLDGVAELIDAVAAPGTELVILATSREPLQVADETVVPIEPLPVPAAPAVVVAAVPATAPATPFGGESEDSPAIEASASVQLFLDRAGIGIPPGPDRAVVLEKVAAICRAVDGVPLAIELAAARARAYSVDEILRQVSSDPGALQYTRRGVPEHQQSVRQAVAWSHRMLSASERLIHRRVSVVPGAFTTETVASLSGTDHAEAQDALIALVHKSMITPLGPARVSGPSQFAQLAIIRAHARHELEADHETQEAERSRDARVSDLVLARPRLGHADEPAWMNSIDDDIAAVRSTLHDTLRERPDALGTALSRRLTMYWFYRGLVPEAERWYALTAAVPNASPLDRAGALLGLAGVRALAQRMDQARPLIEEGMRAAAARTPQEDIGYGEMLLQLAGAALLAGDYATSTDLARTSMQLAEKHGDEALALISEARLTSDPSKASADVAPQLYQRALALDNHYAAFIAANTACLRAMVIGDPSSGLVWSDRAIEANLRHEIGQAQGMFEVRANLLALAGRPEDALRMYSAARFHNARAGLPWPSREITAALLARSISQVDRTAYETAWRAGRQLTLFDIATAP